MSAGYGYYHIEFYQNDGTADEAKAKEAFDFCMEKYEWFRENEPFVLEGNTITGNYDEYPEGIDIKDTDIPQSMGSLGGWMKSINDAVNPAGFAGSIVVDYSETSYESNSYIANSMIAGKLGFPDYFQFNSQVNGELVDDDYYAALSGDGSYRHYRGKFRNKKTGQTVLAGGVGIVPSPDSDYESVFEACRDDEHACRFDIEDESSYLYDKNGGYIQSMDTEVFDHFDEGFDPIEGLFDAEGLDDNPEDWEFLGFDMEPDIFTRTQEELKNK